MVPGKAERCVVVMARKPAIGKVKTRLQPYLGRYRTALVYQQLLQQNLDVVQRFPCDNRVIACMPDTRHRLFQVRRRSGLWRLMRQPEGDLGVRMHRLFSLLLKRSRTVVLVGSDLANLDAQLLQQAFDELSSGSNLVLGTTTDGGYGMIGLNHSEPGLFRNIPWSTSRVARVTLVRAACAGIPYKPVNGLWDIDEAADYRRFRSMGNTGFRSARL